ncbi:P-loop containing nucleoside triphosphate hydrolase protein [Emericellopsis atlantica]|uniref:P-loop containing nucleoside triphosphate hydrolase protein n=1 Tax=Emericellopsis atlantica TaxID=2614577 RepID=A0A9P8CTA4_9HYPO|nr:P-loop containing nucleoside triphosphate hydrolase protein [Emericellopsis atlantica]KAG9258944.1 P-loop containing nucleoside triphosphate hydrolase protein [Emericellopsis atlantica]
MPPRCAPGTATLAPFLYPSLFLVRVSSRITQYRCSSTTQVINDLPESRLNPAPDDYANPKFADKAELTLYAGRGGNGCVSFLREAFMPDGPPNGGDGGAGGNIYIQAAHGETSLHKIARRRFVRAGRGRHGQGSARSGTKGEDVIITVPVGTIVREIERHDPYAEEEMSYRVFRGLEKQRKREQREAEEQRKRLAKAAEEEEDEYERAIMQDLLEKQDENENEDEDGSPQDPRNHKWLLYPGLSKSEMGNEQFPKLPKRTKYLSQPPGPIQLDLSRPTEHPVLLATGGIGGLGNPHFNSRQHPRPMFATKGDEAVTMKIELELKLLADVGLVGLPNAGKSTLLRALTNSRTRVGNWAFTTLQPNIGTVVLDKYTGRPSIPSRDRASTAADPRTRFTVADIPGLIEGAHLDRGLGIAFLRHVERAGVLAFVIDLSAGDAVKALNSLWREVGLYAQMREEEDRSRETSSHIDWSMTEDGSSRPLDVLNADLTSPNHTPAAAKHIAGKPWFVVATKADKPDTKDNYRQLSTYLEKITKGEVGHPSGVEGAWIKKCTAIPVSAINKQGVDRITHWTVGLLDE